MRHMKVTNTVFSNKSLIMNTMDGIILWSQYEHFYYELKYKALQSNTPCINVSKHLFMNPYKYKIN